MCLSVGRRIGAGRRRTELSGGALSVWGKVITGYKMFIPHTLTTFSYLADPAKSKGLQTDIHNPVYSVKTKQKRAVQGAGMVKTDRHLLFLIKGMRGEVAKAEIPKWRFSPFFLSLKLHAMDIIIHGKSFISSLFNSSY